MPQHVCNGAVLMCNGAMPPGIGTLIVQPLNRTLTFNQPAATVMDFVPMLNIMPFGACKSPTNPAVISALGAPVPCMPAPVGPWNPGVANVQLGNMLVLNNTSKLMCAMGGEISIAFAGQVTEETP